MIIWIYHLDHLLVNIAIPISKFIAECQFDFYQIWIINTSYIVCISKDVIWRCNFDKYIATGLIRKKTFKA